MAMDARDASFRDLIGKLAEASTAQLTAISSVPVQLAVSDVGGFDPRVVRGTFSGPPLTVQVEWAGQDLGALIFVDRQFFLQAAALITGKEAPLDPEDRGDRAELEGIFRLSLDAASEALRELSGGDVQFGPLHLLSEASPDVGALTGFSMASLDVSVGELASRIICLASPQMVADLLGNVQVDASDQEAAQGAEQVRVRPGAFAPLEDRTYTVGSARSLDLLMDIELPVSVELGRVNMTIRSILGLGPGAVVELDKFSGEPVDLLVNNKKFAEGEVVVVDQNFGVRITALVGAAERLNAAREGRSE
jgi:flagellar motor switch protein FliN/FliY